MPPGRVRDQLRRPEPDRGPGASGISSAQPAPAMTDKQLARTVHHGRKITFDRIARDPITGYLGGLDAMNYLVLIPGEESVTQMLVARAGVCTLTLHQESTLDTEPLVAEIERILSAFRESLRRHHGFPAESSKAS
jgi:hypothetical protein